MKISTLFANCKKPVIACLVMLCCLIMKSEVGWGQVVMSNTTQTGVCSGTYYDPGGTGNYPNNSNVTQTFIPSSGNRMSFNFTAFRTSNSSDYLIIYNGNSIAAPVIGTYSGTSTIGTISSTANDGSLTFRFVSDGATNQTGWTAAISCIPVQYRAQFISMNTGSTNWCVGETRNVTVTVKNTGTATWTNASPQIRIGAKFNANSDYDYRVNAADLTPGSQTTYTIAVTAPSTASATENISFDVVNEGTCWFAWNSGLCGPGNSVFTSPTQTILTSTSITAQPSTTTQTLCQGISATALSVTASGSGLNYQWYSNTIASNIGGTLISGATASSYSPSTTIAGTLYYYCIVTGTCGTVISNVSGAVKINVRPVSPIAGNNFRCGTGTVTISATPGAGETIDWYAASTGGTALATNTNNYTTPSISATTTYYAQSRNTTTSCISVTRTAVTATVSSVPTPTLTSSTNNPCANINVTYTTEPGQTNYIWTFTGTAGTDYTIVSGGNNSSNTAVVKWLTSGNKTVTANYTTTGGCSGASAASKTVSVLTAPTGSFSIFETSGNTDNDGIICTNASVRFTFTPAVTMPPQTIGSYTFKVNGTTMQTGGPTANSYNPTSLANGDQVTVDVSNSNNCGATFGPIVITVNPLPTPTLTANKSAICPGDEVTFTAGGGTYYTFNVNGSPVQSGASPTYTTPDLIAGNSVTVDVKNANGCTATSSPVSIAINPVPSGTLSATENSGTAANDNKICVGDYVTFTAAPLVAGYTYNFKINGVTAQNISSNTYTTSFASAGNPVITVEVTNSTGCTASFGPQQVITVVSLPTGSLTATENSGTNNDNIICPGSPVTFTANAGYSNYAFYLNGTGAPLQNNSTRTYTTSSLVNGDYITVVITNTSGCTSTFTSPAITVVPLPSGTLSADRTTICAGAEIVFTATPGFTNYKFRINGGVPKQTGTDNTFTWTGFANGNTVTVEASNAQTCFATFNPITITVNPLPTGSILPKETSGLTNNDGVICAGDSIVFTATAGFANYNFKLNGTSVQNTASNTYTNKTLTNGDKVTVEVTSSLGCGAIFAPVTVTVNQLPTVAPITGAPTVCDGSTITVANATTGGIWKSSDNTIASVNTSGVVTGKAPGTVTISYTVTDAAGCSISATKNITVNDVPVVDGITGKSNVCIGNIITLVNTTPGGVWSSSDAGIATVDASGNVAGIAAGAAVISYTVTNTATGCNTIKTKSITVNSLPVVAAITATGPFAVCVNSGLQLQDATAGGAWSSSDNSIATVNSVSGLVTGIAGGTATISYTVKDGNNCSTTVTVNITINALPQPTLAGPDLICPGTTGVYTTEQNKINYNWIVTGGHVDSAGGSGDYGIKVTWSAAGPYSVYVNYTDPVTGCSGDTAVTVPNGTASSPTISGPDKVCAGSAGTVYTTEAGKLNYVWNITGGTITSGLTTSTVTVTWNTVGTGLISVNYTLPDGCNAASPTVYDVTVKPLPTATISGTTSVCQGAGQPVITFTGANASRPFTFSYTINGVSQPDVTTSTTSSSVTVTAPTDMPGIFTYSLVSVSSNNGCSQAQTGSATVTVNALPTATISGTTSVCKDGAAPQITFAGASGIAPYTFTYNINGGSNVTVTTVSGNSVTVTAPTGIPGTFTYNLVGVQNASSTACTQAQTGSATITVNSLPTATIGGTTSVCINSTSPNVTFTGSGETASYTFTYNINGGSPLTVVSNVAGVALVPASTAISGTYTYNLVSVKDGSSSACSQAQAGSSIITVTPASQGGSVASDAIVCSGSNTGTLTLSGNTGNVIRWESSTDNFTTITTIANTTGSYTYNNLTATTKFRAVVQSGNCSSANSVAATITVNAVSAGGTVGGSTSVCSGSNTGTLTLSGKIGNVIRWESSTDNFTTITTIANTTASYTYNNLIATTKFRAVVQNSPCLLPANSTPATVTVNPLPTATISGATSVCQNAPAPNIMFTGGNGTAPYTFTYTVTGTPGNQTVTSTGNTATVAAPTGTVGNYTYTLVSVKDNSSTTCSQNISGQTAIVMVKALPLPPVITPATSTICQGSVLPLLAGTSPVPGSLPFSNTTSVSIPNNAQAGAVRTIAVAGIPSGAVVNSITVSFNITEDDDQGLRINLKAPNGNILNLVNAKGGTGDNFGNSTTNTIISSTGGTIFTTSSSAAPFVSGNPYKADALNNVAGATSGGGNTSNTTVWSDLFGTPNGTWAFSVRDISATGSAGTINNWSITINYTTASVPTAVTWSPVTDLYTDAAAFTPYAGQSLTTVYVKPATDGNKTYTAIIKNAENCTSSSTAQVIVNPTPAVSITANYCDVPNKVRLTADSTPVGSTYIWSTGETTKSIVVDEAGEYTVTVFSGGCSNSATINVANELVTNGDFSAGDNSFSTLYTSRTGSFYNGTPTSGLWPEGDYAVDTSAFSPSNGVGYHPLFHGRDHTTGHGKFMMVNGIHELKILWVQTVNILPNTTYYFSAWGMNLNPGSPAQLSFAVNGEQRGTIADLNIAPKPTSESEVDTSNWRRFYGTWTSGPAVSSAVISIINLNLEANGNDCGIDDISFSTLSTFVNIESAPGSDAQTICVNNPITSIVYSAGTGGTAPAVTGLPPGVTTSWNGVLLTISGAPTAVGNYPYTVSTTGTCQPFTATGYINVQQQTIALSSGSANQTKCINEAITPIVFTIGGSGTGAAATGLPAGVTGSYDAVTKKFTISGTPSAGGTFNYTVTTSGTCTQATATGKLTVNTQSIAAANPSDTTQTVCNNDGISPIIYNLGGTATGASVTGLPPGVNGAVSSGQFRITGTPTASGIYHYTVTTSGTCAPAATTTGTITVKPSADIVLSSPPNSAQQTLCVGQLLDDIRYTLTGTLNASITSGSLPAGVDTATIGGVFKISGTPTAAGTYNYTITAQGECSSISITGKITVRQETISLTAGQPSPTLCLGSTLSNIVFTPGQNAAGATLTGSLPTGLTGSYDAVTNKFTISGSPTELGTFDYTITTPGLCGPPASVSGEIIVKTGTIAGNLSASPYVCSGSNLLINLNGQTGSVQHWESSADGTSWTNIAGTATTLNYASGITVPTQFRALVKSASCNPQYSDTILVGVRYYWTGLSNSNWNIAHNWSNDELPANACNVYTIPAGTPNSPRLKDNVTVPNLSIMPGANLELNDFTLMINNSFIGTGTLSGSARSGLIVNGNAGTVHFNKNSPYNQLKILTINSGGSLTLGGNVVNQDTLNIVAGNSTDGYGTVIANGNLDANGILTLKSDANGTARVGQSAGNIIGNVTVERFIPPLRAWRFLTVPFSSSSQTVQQAWQEGVNNFGLDHNTYNKNPKPGYGTHITGNNNSNLGYDFNTTTNPSYKIWDTTTNTWTTDATEPHTNSTSITDFYGAYCIFVRGSRAVDLSKGTSAPTDPTVLRATGELNQHGSEAIKTYKAKAGKFILLGNPYAATINVLDAINRSAGIEHDKFWIWDPKIAGAGTDNVGAFITYKDGTTVPPVPTPSFPDITSVTRLQSGQAFMVQLSSGNKSATMDFRETDKLDEERNVFGLRAVKPQKPSDPVIYTNLMLGTGKDMVLVDGVAAGFNKRYSAVVNDEDADKLWNFDENIALERDGKSLAIEFRPPVNKKDTLFYNLYLKQKSYTLKVFAANVEAGSTTEAWLIDKYLNKKIAVNLSDTTLYSFVPNSDIKSYRNRFMLVFKQLKNSITTNEDNTADRVVIKTADGNVKIYPNPVSTNKVTLQFNNMDKGNYEVTVYSPKGQKLASRKIQHTGGTAVHPLPLDASWAGGVYNISIISEDSKKAINLNLVISR